MFLGLEFEDGETIYEKLDTNDLKEIEEIARDALEDAPIVYILSGYNDSKYGWQPATHLDYIQKFERES